VELTPGSEFAGYRIEKLIAHGGMGIVYQAVETSLARQVVLKVLLPELASDPAYRMRFEQEAMLAAAVEHPNIVPIFRTGEQDGSLFIAMRHVRGPDLQQLINSYGAMDVEQTRSIIEQIASALDYIHSRGMVHRDVKTANVLVGVSGEDAGRAYLADFGIARAASADRNLTRMGAFLGTREYASPEQLRGEELDWRTDVYALGCVLYECLTGSPPYSDHDSPQLAHMSEPPPLPSASRPELPAGVDEVVATAMAKDREGRYESAGKLAEALTAAIRGSADRADTEVGVVIEPDPRAGGADAGQMEGVAPAVASANMSDMGGVPAGTDLAGSLPPPGSRGETVIGPRRAPAPSEPASPPAQRDDVGAGRLGTVMQDRPPEPEAERLAASASREFHLAGRTFPLVPAAAFAAALLVTLIVGLVVLTSAGPSSSSAPVAPPPPTGLTATQKVLQISLTWGQGGAGAVTYRILRDGVLLRDDYAETTYDDVRNVRLDHTYLYAVYEVVGTHVSKAATIPITTKEPSVAEARLAGTYDVVAYSHHKRQAAFLWRFSPRCSSGACSDEWHSDGRSALARRTGERYRFHYSLSGQNAIFLCGTAPVITRISATVRVRQARAVRGTWSARRLDGTLRLFTPPRAGCRARTDIYTASAQFVG
jgi:predicted Ser/Thr protein kinase